jgi:hypothetical protein
MRRHLMLALQEMSSVAQSMNWQWPCTNRTKAETQQEY